MIRLNTEFGGDLLRGESFEAYVGAQSGLLVRAQAGERRYADCLGWLSVREWAGADQLEEIEAMAAELGAMADTFVIIGVGGSNNASRSVVKALHPSGMRIVYAGNTLSAKALGRMLASLEGHDVVIDCIAKNFETLEPGSSFRLLRQWLCAKYGAEEAARRIVCCGTVGSSFDALAHEQGWRFIPFATNVGGRYTALTAVHLLPLACAGADIRALVLGAEAMERELRGSAAAAPCGEAVVEASGEAARANLALRYACARKLLWDKGYRVELLGFFEPRFRWFAKWWEQLFGESEGKCGKGLFPASAEYSEELHSLGQFVQDGTHLLFETLLDVAGKGEGDSLVLGGTDVKDGFGYLDGADFWDINKASMTATREAHAQVLPVLTLELDATDEAHWGMLFYFFSFSCYLSGSLLGVNPFDQEGVEAYKRLMFKALGK